MTYDFSGKTALVTGGSRGIGKELVKQLSECNAKVFALSKTPANLEKLKKDIPSVNTLCVDLSNWKEVEKLVGSIGTVDLLVNNAGISALTMFGNINEENFDKLYSVNLKPIINISQIMVEKLKKEKKPGSIVNVSSVGSLKHLGYPVYGTAKAAMDHLTKSMALDLAPFGIRVNSVNPTFVESDMLKESVKDPECHFTIETYLKQIPLNRICYVEDVADAVSFLLSDKARMITGVILPVDGGHSCT